MCTSHSVFGLHLQNTTSTYDDTIYIALPITNGKYNILQLFISINLHKNYPHLYKLTFHFTRCYLHCSLSVGYKTK
jgi:hypothetical protein